jgi:hypothetical protein
MFVKLDKNGVPEKSDDIACIPGGRLIGSCINNIKTPTDAYTPIIEEPPPPDLLLISPEDNAVLDNGRSDPWDSIIWDFDWPNVPCGSQYQLYVIGPGAIYPLINKTQYICC